MPTPPTELHLVEQVIAEHPDVARVRVETGEDGAQAPSLVAHLTLTDAVPGSRTPEEESKRVGEWQLIYEWVYGELPGTGGLGDNFVGWHSTYSGLPIALEEMREWRDATVERILSLRPRRVLEIGVGTGLLMARLAPHCEHYVATDFSPTVIDSLTAQVAEVPELAGQVVLRCQEADDFTGLEGEFDTVVLNSVVQYFPNGGYLAEVVRRAAELVAPGGAVFIGDVRNLRLHRAFRTAVLAGELAEHTGPGAAHAHVEDSVLNEKELLVDPDFFTSVARQVPDVAAVDIRLKRARHHNELSRHRYDAVLRKAPRPVTDAAALPTLVWGMEVSGVTGAAERLRARPAAAVRIVDVPDARVAHEVAAARLLETGAGVETVLKALETGGAPAAAADPEALYALGDELGYDTAVCWAASGAPGLVDVVFVPRGPEPAVVSCAATERVGPHPAAYANHPARATRTSTVVAELRATLAERLPAHLVPHSFVVPEGDRDGAGPSPRDAQDTPGTRADQAR
ncbi:class I SAM-dependent methyltransferase [Streptomyces sp. NPDC001339]|uniref:class I SAM-dependent methyltransferase n=1 Tax=Streptomyces sp. NPDC001339 TaxID=3364563 RepID=UPI0036BAF06A